MAVGRASYSIEPEVLSRFNAIVPPGERSKIIETYMRKAVSKLERDAQAIAEEFMTSPDFVQARAEAAERAEAALTDGLED